MDGHDTKINYTSPKTVAEYKQVDFQNYKFKWKPGVRTNVMADVNDIQFGL